MILSFVEPKLRDAENVRRIVRESGLYGNDLNFANLFLLRRKHRITISVRDGFLFRHYDGKRLRGYAFPVGTGDKADALDQIEEDARQRKRPVTFCLMTEAQAAELETVRPGQFEFHSDRGDADYLYDRDRLATLSGRKFHRKRNAAARFEKEYPTWRFEPMTKDRLPDALMTADRWFQARADAERLELSSERNAIESAVIHFGDLGLTGGLLYVDDVPCAMSIVSETVPGVYDVHFEKAVPGMESAYPVLCRETARRLTDARRLNREEDLNLPGLRISKLSWFPAEILGKFSSSPLNVPMSFVNECHCLCGSSAGE